MNSDTIPDKVNIKKKATCFFFCSDRGLPTPYFLTDIVSHKPFIYKG